MEKYGKGLWTRKNGSFFEGEFLNNLEEGFEILCVLIDLSMKEVMKRVKNTDGDSRLNEINFFIKENG